jgi:EAL domain-containing protein (putative c-di-GMP-specific phosphodiesterase class I)
MDTPFEEDNYRINLNASMGVSRYPIDSELPGTLYQFADLAMQHAKKSGGNTLRYYDSSIMDQFLDRLELENKMPGALESGEFFLVFQPQVETDTGAVVGYEALLRWKRPDGSFISPGIFIPVAEDNGFIVTLGAWVLEQACLSIGRLHAGGLPDVKLSVNVSTVQFVQDNFPDLLHEVLEKTGFPSDRLELEVTESAVMHDIDIVAARLNALRSMGISMAIDDFGTGYSSLSYLRTLPIDSLKIDRSFIMEIGSNRPGHEKSAALVTALIGLADNLGLSVVAEGVEDAEQLDFLRKGGCRLVQGFFTGRPGPLPDPSASE